MRSSRSRVGLSNDVGHDRRTVASRVGIRVASVTAGAVSTVFITASSRITTVIIGRDLTTISLATTVGG